MKVAADGSLESPVAKFLSDDESAAVSQRVGAEAGDLLLIVADEWTTTVEVLGQLRNDLGRPPVHEGPYRYVWVVDFPMFVGVDEHGHPKPAHHPFTMPHPDDVDLLETDPMAVRSQAYDLVLNGWELGSGSIRIHDTALQRRVFAVLGIARRGGRPQVRVLPPAVRVRRAAARRVRVRHRPAGGDPRRRGEHPRGDRLPEDAIGHRSDDELAVAGRLIAAGGARHPRAANELNAVTPAQSSRPLGDGQPGPVVTTGHGALRTTWSDTDPSTVRRSPPRPLVPITMTEAGRLVASAHTAGPGAPVRITVSAVVETERGARLVEPALGPGLALVVVLRERLR